jgi:hypothetical protein
MIYIGIALILLGIAQITVTIGVIFAARRYIEDKQAELEERATLILADWFNPASPTEASKMAALLDAAGAIIGGAAARSIMGSLGQRDSSVAKAANGAADEIEATQNPLMGLLGKSKRGRGAAVARLGQLLLPMLSNIGGNGKANDRMGKPPQSFSM